MIASSAQFCAWRWAGRGCWRVRVGVPGPCCLYSRQCIHYINNIIINNVCILLFREFTVIFCIDRALSSTPHTTEISWGNELQTVTRDSTPRPP
jgi:hypothetical protein